MRTRTSYYDGVIPVRVVADLVHCPAQAWLELRGPRISWNRPHWSPEDPGDPLDRYPAIVEALGGEPEMVEEEVVLYSQALGIAGKADIVAYRGRRAAVVEVKARDTVLERARLQASLYALIVSERGYRALPVVVWPGGYEVLEPISLSRALEHVRRARRILARPTPPPPGPKARCVSCNYRLVCPYYTGRPG